MKNANFLKSMVIALGCFFLITSCEKSESETELPKQDSQEEGFNSTTGNTDSAAEDFSEALLPVLQMQFDGSMSKEQVDAKFDEAVAKFIKEDGTTSKSSTEWYYEVRTFTGTQTNNDTNGNVWAKVNFVTDRGHRHLAWMKLDHSWPYNDHEGGWDVYLFRSPIQNPSISWLEAERASLALQGTDGWYVRYFDIHVHTSDQTANSSGSTHVYSDPQVWLDNSSSGAFDYYHTGTVGSGRLNF